VPKGNRGDGQRRRQCNQNCNRQIVSQHIGNEKALARTTKVYHIFKFLAFFKAHGSYRETLKDDPAPSAVLAGEGARNVTLAIALSDGVAFVVDFLAACQGNLQLGPPFG
jgi:hypothetical protein